MLLNYAIWESVAHFRTAFNHPEFKAALDQYPSSAIASPHLFNACSPRKNEGLRREISGVLAGFAALLQFFARVYTHLHIGQDVWQADIQGLQQITTGRIRRGDAQATATVFAFHFR